MHRIVLMALMLPVVAAGAPQGAATASDWEGRWEGGLEVPGATLTLVVTIERTAEGELGARFDSPDQGAYGIPVARVEAVDGRLRLELPAIGATFEGERTGSDEVAGSWSQGGMEFPLRLERVGPADADARPPRRPQDPVEPYPYRSEDVTFPNPGAGIRLAGTLTLPPADAPVPAAVLITGSGPQDRDEALMGHRPFLVLSDHLTRAGVAVLRVDDRGVGESGGAFATATSTDFAGDVEAAMEYLRARPEVDSGAIGLIGHSEGGLIAPMVANRRDDVAWAVLLAAPGLPGRELLELQGRALLGAMDLPADLIDASTRLQNAMFELAVGREAERLGDDELRARVDSLLDAELAELTPAERAALGIPEGTEAAWKEQQSASLMSPWMRQFLRHDPREDLERMDRVPVLALNGSLDLQVPAERNLREIGDALERAGNPDVTLVELPGLNHLFQTATTGHPSEYAVIEETLAPVALETIASWILDRFPSPASSIFDPDPELP